MNAFPFGIPAQSKHDELSPPQTPHSSFSKIEPHVLSQPDEASSPQPQPKSTLPSQSPRPEQSSTIQHSPSGIEIQSVSEEEPTL